MASSISVGDHIPSFTLASHRGGFVRSDDLLGKDPKDHTPGCTAEACAFRDHYEEFKTAGAEVVGISSDSPETHVSFVGKHSLPFVLLSDPDNAVRKKFGVTRHAALIPGRETFIIDKHGVVVHHFRSLLNAIGHVEEARKIVDRLATER
jgi:peroxiredoxin Q/BCP